MKKLPSLNLEVIRFTTEDVIVTSGTGTTVGATYSPLTEGVRYFALGEEINQYRSSSNCNEKYVSSFTYNPSTDTFTLIYRDECKIKEVSNKSNFTYSYAWYDNIWLTENQPKEYYLEIGWTR